MEIPKREINKTQTTIRTIEATNRRLGAKSTDGFFFLLNRIEEPNSSQDINSKHGCSYNFKILGMYIYNEKKCCIMNDNLMQLILVQFFFWDELVKNINNREQTRQS